ncbi:MAG: efflux RND transporter periplasmic adaptor subunit [Candidatus Korobacteraceae bacterium]|jgi:RND family efflux transporter MFP subunit
MKTRNYVLRIIALAAVVAISFALLFGNKLRAFQHDHSSSPAAAANAGGRKVLYWYDAMNPQHSYSKPGKAPDGMDLVPKYADEQPGQSAQAAEHPQEASAAPAPANSNDKRKILYWYDPMHPTYKSDKPGIAPDCGMELVPKYADEAGGQEAAAGTVNITPARQQLIGVRTATVEQKRLTRDIRTTAQIVPDETRIAHIHVKVSGFVDKVYVDFVGQLVKKGQPVFTLYSPDLVATEQEYLIAKRGERTLGSAPYQEVSQGAQSLLRSARERLKLWDISDEQIRKLDETGEVSKTLTIYSPITGFVTDRKVFPQVSVTPEMDLYVVSDLSTIWANADIYEYELPFVKVGQVAKLQLSYYPGKTYSGRIAYIYPSLDPNTHTAKARIAIPNSNFELKPQMFADVQLKIDYGKKIVVPQDAILNSGNEQTVFVAHDDGSFEPRKVTVGPALDGNAVVLSGLKAGETIVTSGNFLIDSESRMKSAAASMQ